MPPPGTGRHCRLGSKGFTVRHTKGVGHGVYGILATAGSTNIIITDNIEQGATGPIGPVGTAGIWWEIRRLPTR